MKIMKTTIMGKTMKFWTMAMAVGFAALACGGADDKDLVGSKVCIPGATQECVCPGGIVGAQACRDDGAGYLTCQCGGGSGAGGSAGSGGDSGPGGSAGSAGSAGTCNGRTTCPMPGADGGAQLCGQLDNYCGGTISCGCEFGACGGGACECKRIDQYDALCATNYPTKPIAMSCSTSATPPGCIHVDPSRGFPSGVMSNCCGH